MSENKIDSLHISIEADVDKALAGVDKVKEALKKLSEYTKKLDFGKFKIDTSETNKVSAAYEKLNNKVSKSTEKIAKSTQDSVKKAKDSLYDFEELIDKTNDEWKNSNFERKAKYRAAAMKKHPEYDYSETPPEEIGFQEDISSKMKWAKEKYSEIGEYLKTYESLWDKNSALPKRKRKKITSDDVFGEMYQKNGLEDSGLGEKLTKYSSGLSEYTNRVAKATKQTGGFTAGLSRLGKMIGQSFIFTVFYRGMHLIGEGLKEGRENLYQYSKAFSGTFANSLDRITSSFLYLKNSVGAAFAPLINVAASAIEFVTDKVVGLFNLANQLIAKLTGAATWTRAVKVQQEYAESTQAAADAVQNLLVGFDELNILGAQSAGASALNTPDYSSMFEEVPIEDINPVVGKIADKIQEIWDKLKEFRSWLNNTFDLDLTDIQVAVGTIGLAFLSWKVSTSFLKSLFDVQSKLDAFKVGTELTISIIGFVVEYEAIKNIASGNAELQDYILAALGAGLGITGLTLALGPAGFIVGVGVTLAIAAKAELDAQKEEYFKSELHEKLSKLVEDANQNLEESVDLKLRVDAIGIEVDEVEQKFAILRDLVHQAFDINDIPAQNRSSEEADKLQGLVQAINDMGIIEIHFDDGYIRETREQVQGLIDDQYEYYMTIALQEAIVEAYRDQAEAAYQLKKSQEDAAIATGEYEDAQRRLFEGSLTEMDKLFLGIDDASDVTSEKMDSLIGNIVQGFSGARDAGVDVINAIAEKLGWQTGLAKENIGEQIAALGEAETAYDKNKQAIQNNADAFDNATGAAKYFTDYLAEVTKGNYTYKLGVEVDDKELQELHESVQKIGRAKQDRIMKAAGIPGFANGGFPDEGQVFFAREDGSPELVGSIGGRTAVANNEDIVAGIARGVMEANAGTEHLLRALIKAVESQGGGNTTVTISTSDIVSALNRKNRRDGRTVVPVGV